MWELDHKEGWVSKNGYFWIVMLEKTLESTLDCKEIKPVKSKGNQPWTFTGRTVAKAEAPILWPPDVNSQLTRQLLMLGKTEDKRRRGWQRMKWLESITNSMGMNLRKLWETVGDRGAVVHGVAESQTWLSDWTTKFGRGRRPVKQINTLKYYAGNVMEHNAESEKFCAKVIPK